MIQGPIHICKIIGYVRQRVLRSLFFSVLLAASYIYTKLSYRRNFSTHRPTLYLIVPHTLSVLPMNSFKPLSKQFSFPSFLSSHLHTQFPSATAILNTADTFHCFPIVVVRHPSCSVPQSQTLDSCQCHFPNPTNSLVRFLAIFKTSSVKLHFPQNHHRLN